MADTHLNPIDLAQTDQATNPPAGYTRIQAKTNGTVVLRSPAGVETSLAGAVTMASALLTADQTNTTVTPAVLTGHTFTIPPGKTALIQGTLAYTGAATTTGALYGIRVAQAAGASANAQGSWFITNAIVNTAAATALEDGDVFNVAAGANAIGSVLSTGSTSATVPQGARLTAIVTNRSTNVNTTVTIEFASEVAGSAAIARIGTSATCIIG